MPSTLMMPDRLRPSVSARAPESVIARWSRDVRAAEGDDGNRATIDILDFIGEDFFGEGITPRRISGALRSIGAETDVTVRINSPGGSVADGTAIYNMLAAHKGHVRVEVIGVAASIASVIAMAGDEIVMDLGALLFVHNAWTIGIGNAEDMRAIADELDIFDGAITDVYAERTGTDRGRIAELMAADTWLDGDTAVREGFADRTAKVATDNTASGQARAAPHSSARMGRVTPQASRRTEMPENNKAAPANEPAGLTTADVENARAEARAEGISAGASAERERVAAIIGAEGISGEGPRMAAALDLASRAPGMSADEVVAFVTTNVAAAPKASSADASLSARGKQPDSLAAAGIDSPPQQPRAKLNANSIYAARAAAVTNAKEA